jgi:O-antigen/teichoic acid export membrane protein
MRNSVIAASLISVGLNVALIPRFGLVGAAIATTVGVASQNIIASVLVHRLLDIRVFEWALPGRRS